MLVYLLTRCDAEAYHSALQEACWVCLDSGAEDEGGRGLVRPCKCPRAVHQVCLARWQLRSAGKG